ncbi:unnamed protein product [Brachionus calyciflorus]|uniref:Methyltransferase domain-containing protein n=1 Tax=Brachionus calyciflorus TaxID=104777 RepID=A0A813Z9Q2_9BILA|nr:unnamed protein product [Brachionus calyciflorus]
MSRPELDKVNKLNFYQNLLKEIYSLVEENRSLLNTNNVQFLVEDHWNSKFNTELKNDLEIFLKEKLENNSSVNLLKYFIQNQPDPKLPYLNSLFDRLKNLFNTWDYKVCTNQDELIKMDRPDLIEFNQIVKQRFTIVQKQNRFMNTKKLYEVDHMSKFVASLCKKQDIFNIVDIGSGRAYISAQLSSSIFDDQFNVIALESSENNVESSMKRLNQMKNNKTPLCPLQVESKFKTITKFIQSSTQLNDIIRQNKASKQLENYALIGLHSCGNLSNSIINIYLDNRESERKLLCNVSCCYNLLREKYDIKIGDINEMDKKSCFPMSQYLNDLKYSLSYNMKIQACHCLFKCLSSVDDFKEQDNLIRWYRCVFQVIIYEFFKSKFSDDPNSTDFNVTVGKKIIGSNSVLSFVSYAKNALKKLGLNNEELNDDKINSYIEKNSIMKQRFDIYIQLKYILSTTMEYLILLDRLVYLYEVDHEEKLEHFLVKLFDPVKSPRCHALISYTK